MDQSTPDSRLHAEPDAGPDTLADADAESGGWDDESATAEAEPATGPQVAELTDRQRQILDFERRWWRHAGAKEQAVRDTFGLSATRYYQLLNALLDEPAALAYDPILVNRLRRLRATRLRARTARRP